MSIRKIILTTTVLSLPLAGGAWAQSNDAFLDQNGTGNDALIEQTGSNNDAGSSVNAITQNGNDNDLDVLQDGDQNKFGLKNGGNQNEVDQNGNANTASVSQLSDGNVFNVLQQDSTGVAGTNTASVTQKASAPGTVPSAPPFQGLSFGNLLSRVEQTNTGAGVNSVVVSQDVSNTSLNSYSRNVIGDMNREPGWIFLGTNLNRPNGGVVQNGTDNTANLTQDGAGNLIRLSNQTGDGNSVDLDQIGNRNTIARVEQDSSGKTLGNVANVLQQGDRNGDALMTGNASSVGATNSSILQTGGDNGVNYSALGNDNLFGFTQIGDGNTVGTVSVIGMLNQTGGYQMGDDNVITIAPITGDANNVGVKQLGDTNDADIALTNNSNLNKVLVTQMGNTNIADVDVDGSKNELTISQATGGLGNGNEATFDVKGSTNFAELTQSGDNMFTLTINGSDNNMGVSGFVSGTDAASTGLTPGIFTQSGLGNIASITVSSNSNRFATKQFGDDNLITASVSGGSGNKFGIAQTGNNNVAMLSQVGSGNNAGIVQ